MFVLTTVADTIRISPSMFVQPTLSSVHDEIEKKYPNRVIMDVGLVICRYGDALQLGDGVCVAGDGAAHHEVVFRLVVFRPFVEEVCVGNILESNEDGIKVTIGFFDDIFIPSYWMLRPSNYDYESGLWVWTPTYDEEDEEEGNGNAEAKEDQQNRFEMEIGSEIRFKIKAINFTQVTNTAKGVQATTSTTAASKSRIFSKKSSTNSSLSASGNAEVAGASTGVTPADAVRGTNGPSGGVDDNKNRPVRKRSTSVDLSDASTIPASMHVTASICEDGLGIVDWWSSNDDQDEGDTLDEGESDIHDDGEDADGYTHTEVDEYQ